MSTEKSAPGPFESPEMELSARQSGLSFQRTRMSADRTLMSMLRTSISLVGFGFTIAQFFQHLRQMPEYAPLLGSYPGRNFGLAMVLLGIALLAAELVQHAVFVRSLRAEHALLVRQGLLHGEEPFARSVVFYLALLFLLFAVAVVLSMLLRAGPFH